jgi:glutathione peroxidase
MPHRHLAIAMMVLAGCASTHGPSPEKAPPKATDAEGAVVNQTVTSLNGKTVNLSDYRGKTLLIVNTASECGYTPQYAGLQSLYDKYKDRGLVIVGFPSNDFGGQEPGGAEEIATFCKKNYGVTFPMMSKVHAKGPEISPVYKTLTQDTPEGIRGEVKWNFTKFLIDPQGKVVARFEPKVEPQSPEIADAVEKNLPAQ